MVKTTKGIFPTSLPSSGRFKYFVWMSGHPLNEFVRVFELRALDFFEFIVQQVDETLPDIKSIVCTSCASAP